MNNPLEGQALLDRIVARAQNSAMGLGEPEEGKTYSLDAYESKGLDSIALVLVSAHHAKYDLVSLMQAAMEEIAEQRDSAAPGLTAGRSSATVPPQ